MDWTHSIRTRRTATADGRFTIEPAAGGYVLRDARTGDTWTAASRTTLRMIAHVLAGDVQSTGAVQRKAA